MSGWCWTHHGFDQTILQYSQENCLKVIFIATACQLHPCPLCQVQQWSIMRIMHFFTTRVTGLPNLFMSRCFWYQASLHLPPCRPKCWQLLPNPGFLHMRWSSDCMFAHQVWDLLPSNCWENHLGPLLGKDCDLMLAEGPASFILAFGFSRIRTIAPTFLEVVESLFLFDWVPGGWNGRYCSNPVCGWHLFFPFLSIPSDLHLLSKRTRSSWRNK